MIPHLPLLAAVVTGVAVHLGLFIRGEWHLFVAHIALVHGSLFLGLWLLTSYFVDNSAIYTSIVLASAYLLSLFTSMTTYRLFFHPLRHFPGPKIAAVTKFWHVWQSRHSNNFQVMEKMFETYGTVVRTGPNEISIFHPAGIELLDGVKYYLNNKKDVWYDIIHPKVSVVFNRDRKDAKLQRRTWQQAVSTKCLQEYSQRIVPLGRQLLETINVYNAQPVKVNDVMSWLAFDMMGAIAFGEDFSMVSAREQQRVLTDIRNALSMISPFVDAMWLGRVGFAFFPFLKEIRAWSNSVDFCCSRMEKRMQTEPEGVDISTFFLKEFYEREKELPLASRRNLLMGSSISVMVAGSDTTRAGIIAMIYFLCRYPDHARKIYDEVKDVDEADMNVLASLTHLNAFVKETLRLAPPAMTGQSRIMGSEGLQVDDVFIPGGTKVTAPKWVSQRLHRAFEKPGEFIPERWSSKPELVYDARAYAPFGAGPRLCVGKNISLIEMRYIGALLLKQYEIEFSAKHNSDDFWTYMKDEVTMQPGDVQCIFKSRA